MGMGKGDAMTEAAQSVEVARRERFLAGRICATVAFALAFFLLCGITLFVVPKFEKIFAEFNAALPSATMLLVGSSRFCREHWLVAVPLVMLVIAGVMVLVWKGPRSWVVAVLIAALASIPLLVAGTTIAAR